MAAQLEPVDFDPFARPASSAGSKPRIELEPVEHDPFGEQSVVERGIVLPLATTSDGKTSIAMPQIVETPYRRFMELWADLSREPGAEITPSMASKAFDAATAALTGPGAAAARVAAPALVKPQVAEAAARLGVEVPRAAVGSSTMESAGRVLKELPLGGSIASKSEQALAGLENAAAGAIVDAGTGRPASRSFRDWFQARGLSEEDLAAEAGTTPRTKQPAAYEAPAGSEGAMRIVTPDGSMEVSARAELMELDDLRAAAGEFQPRDRSRAEYVQGVRERAARLDPEQLRPGRVSDSGAPIILDDNTIISGNGRAMSIAEAYRRPDLAAQADAYRASLGPRAAGMKNPILVMRADGMASDQAARFADLSNRGRIAQMSATERAARDAKALGADDVHLFKGGDFDAAQNADFLRAFTSKAVSSGEGAALAKDGRLTQEGVTRMRNAVLASAYDDSALLSRLVESTDDNVRALTGALTDSAPDLAGLKASVANGTVMPALDPTKAVTEAVRKIADLRSNNVTPARFFSQIDAFETLDPMAAQWIRAFYNEALDRPVSRQQMTDIIRRYVGEAEKHAPDALFPDPTTANDVLRVAVKGRDPNDVLLPSPNVEKPVAPPTTLPAPAAATSPNSLKSWQARERTPQERVFEARKARLADALGLDQNITPSAAISRIDEMVRSKASADVAGLLKAKNILDAETWSDVGQEMLRRSGLGDDLGRFATAYAAMTDTAKTALFGSEMRQRLDDIAVLSTKFGTLKELATPRVAEALASVPVIGTALSRMATPARGALAAGIAVSADMGLSAATTYAAARFLSKPQGAKAVSRWLSALTKTGAATERSTQALVALAARNLAKELAEESGVDEREIARRIDHASRGAR